ncbi:hypothetical protein [Curtobacterium flaccumfaciens]|uniref:hypothetical protein n=1 Tax=Curtobacterium flaccumfaciens TaxID=2035 RepID=UPI00217580F6|nr:hypothetical protein [Curtobacterium flaccumfaciens]MCS5495279.1 hypothetical protein [Curtobacterium flaccumfaciens pv. flaccumfaciens]
MTSVIRERAKVLITVKASPQPSSSYGDTVCVAGLRLDDEPRWIRLYPVPFRHLNSDQQFRKYEIVELDVTRRPKDGRPESYNPTLDSIARVGHLKEWKDRAPLLNPMATDTACGMRRGTTGKPNGKSLGLVRARNVLGLDFAEHPGWSIAERRKMERFLTEPDLFGGTDRKTPLLTAPQFKVWFRYECEEDTCGGHRQQILDWELTMLQSKYRHSPSSDVRRVVEEKFLDQMCGPDRVPHFYLGNFERAQKRQIFSILGVYWPKRVSAEALSLF